MKYINPVSKVLSLNTKRAALEEIVIATSEPEPYEDWTVNEMHFDDAVDDLFKK